MKNFRPCPKCGGTDILRIPSSKSYDNIISTGILSTVQVARFICASCGFVEEWVESPEDIEALRRRDEPA